MILSLLHIGQFANRCFSLQKVVIVASGKDKNGAIQETELLDFATEEWLPGPALPRGNLKFAEQKSPFSFYLFEKLFIIVIS